MKSKAADESPKKRKRRTIAELIADLEAERVALLEHQKVQEVSSSPAHHAALAAIKQLDKAASLAAAEGESALRRALLDARDALAPCLEERGLNLPKARRPRGPRPRE